MKKLIVCGARHFLVVTSQCTKSLFHCSGMRSQQHREANRGKKSMQCYSFFCLYLHFIHLLQLQGTRPSQVVRPNPGRTVRQVCYWTTRVLQKEKWLWQGNHRRWSDRYGNKVYKFSLLWIRQGFNVVSHSGLYQASGRSRDSWSHIHCPRNDRFSQVN